MSFLDSQGLKSRRKEWGHLFGFHVSFLSIILKLSKIVFFFHFLTDVSNKSKAVTAVYAYAFESSRFTLIENGIGYYAMTYSLEDISD